MAKHEEADVKNRVAELIFKGHEGAYWDFKQKWHTNRAKLLHDILCMANNLHDEDGFIIFGVNDEAKVCGIDSSDGNRKNQADIIDWLSHINFSNDRPEVQVFSGITICEKVVDIIVIIQRNNGPYFLKEKYTDGKTHVLPVIYTRNGDTNTPITESPIFSQIETLWRKRFGLLHSVKEKALKYIYDIDNWEFIDGNNKENAIWYYKGDPAYTVTTESDDEDECDKSIGFEFYYLCTFLNVAYHPGICFEQSFLRYNNLRLFEGLVAMADECRTKVVDNHGGYYVKGTLTHGMYEFVFAYMCGNYSHEAKMQIERVVPIYESELEKDKFEQYAKSKGWNRFDKIIGSHSGYFKKRLDACSVEMPTVIDGVGSERNIERLQAEQCSGKLFNFYHENEFSESEQKIISQKIKEGFVLVEMLKKWRSNSND